MIRGFSYCILTGLLFACGKDDPAPTDASTTGDASINDGQVTPDASPDANRDASLPSLEECGSFVGEGENGLLPGADATNDGLAVAMEFRGALKYGDNSFESSEFWRGGIAYFSTNTIQPQWVRVFDGTDNVSLNDVLIGTTGEVYAAGSFGGTMNLSDEDTLVAEVDTKDAIVLRMDTSSKQVAWSLQLEGTKFPTGSFVVDAGADTLVAVGRFTGELSHGDTLLSSGSSLSGPDIWVASIAKESGSVNWLVKVSGGEGYDQATDVIVDGGAIYLTGSSRASGSTVEQVFLSKLDLASGEERWRTKPEGGGEAFGRRLFTEAGVLYVMGQASADREDGEADMFLGRYSIEDGSELGHRSHLLDEAEEFGRGKIVKLAGFLPLGSGQALLITPTIRRVDLGSLSLIDSFGPNVATSEPKMNGLRVIGPVGDRVYAYGHVGNVIGDRQSAIRCLKLP